MNELKIHTIPDSLFVESATNGRNSGVHILEVESGADILEERDTIIDWLTANPAEDRLVVNMFHEIDGPLKEVWDVKNFRDIIADEEVGFFEDAYRLLDDLNRFIRDDKSVNEATRSDVIETFLMNYHFWGRKLVLYLAFRRIGESQLKRCSSLVAVMHAYDFPKVFVKEPLEGKSYGPFSVVAFILVKVVIWLRDTIYGFFRHLLTILLVWPYKLLVKRPAKLYVYPSIDWFRTLLEERPHPITLRFILNALKESYENIYYEAKLVVTKRIWNAFFEIYTAIYYEVIMVFRFFGVYQHLFQKHLALESSLAGVAFVKAHPANESKTGRTILALVEDSGTGVNMKSAKAIIELLGASGVNVALYTSSPFVRKSFPDSCEWRINLGLKQAVMTKFRSIIGVISLNRLIGHFIIEQERPLFLESVFRALVKSSLGSFKYSIQSSSVLDLAIKRYGIKTAVAVGETNMVNAMERLGNHCVTCAGVFPILVSDHPTYKLWLADHHLVYGGQARDVLVSAGVAPTRITCVGSEHYDQSMRKKGLKDESREYINEKLPMTKGKRYFVLATENRSNQMAEIGPVMESVSRTDDLFLIVKLHPYDMEGEFTKEWKRIGSPANVIIVKNIDVSSLINVCEAVITMQSNLIIEAAMMGVPSIIIRFTESNPYMLDFVEEGVGIGASSADECIEKMRGLLNDPELQAEAMEKIKKAGARFNDPADGKSAERIVDAVLETYPETP